MMLSLQPDVPNGFLLVWIGDRTVFSSPMFFGNHLSVMKSTNSFFFIFLFFFVPLPSPIVLVCAFNLKRFPKRGTSVKRTRFLVKSDFQDNPEGTNDIPRFSGMTFHDF